MYVTARKQYMHPHCIHIYMYMSFDMYDPHQGHGPLLRQVTACSMRNESCLFHAIDNIPPWLMAMVTCPYAHRFNTLQNKHIRACAYLFIERERDQ